MHKIFLNTTDRNNKSVILKKDDDIIAEKTGDLDIIQSIRELLEENDLEITDIEEVVPVLGPGSFTGLKIGVTISNILNWVNGNKDIKELDVPNYGRGPNITLKKF